MLKRFIQHSLVTKKKRNREKKNTSKAYYTISSVLCYPEYYGYKYVWLFQNLKASKLLLPTVRRPLQ